MSGTNRTGTWKRMLGYTRAYRMSAAAALLSAVLSVGASLAGPHWIGKAIDYMSGAGRVDFRTVSVYLGALALTYVIGSFFAWSLTVSVNRIACLSVRDMREELFRKLQQLPLRFHDNHPHGDSISRFVNDMETVSDGLQQGFGTLITGLLTIAGAVLLMAATSPVLTLVVLLLTPASYGTARYLAKRSQKLFREQAQALGSLNGYVEETVGGLKTVKALHGEERICRTFAEKNDHLYRVGIDAQYVGSLANPATRLIQNLTLSVVSVIGCIAVLRGHATVGGLAAFVIYAGQFAKPLNEITGVLSQIQAAVAGAGRIFDILDLPPEKPDAAEMMPQAGCKGRVIFDRVGFAYLPGKPLIHDFSLQVEPGMRVAIVGHSGAGKTTLVNLLMRYYDMDSGAITVDGTDIRAVSRDSLRRCFGMVLQDTWLIAGTIRDNIAYGRPDASDEEVEAAAQAAEAHGFIRRLPYGYDTVIAASGDNISQGQKQLLTIARVLLANPPMLILDEATSSIDTRTELRIQRAFRRMMDGRTSFVIAHRLSTVREADLILFMKDGDIAEKGTHEELLRANGHYARLYATQLTDGGTG